MNSEKFEKYRKSVKNYRNYVDCEDYGSIIEELITEVESLSGLLDEAIRVLEQNHTSSHPSARTLITTMSPTFRDWRGRRLTSQVRKANVVTEKWRQ